MDIDRIVMPERRRITPSWLLVKPKSLEDKENTPYEPPEKKLKKHSSTGLEGMENPECGSSQSPGLDDLIKLLRDPNSYKEGCFVLHPNGLGLDILQRKDRQRDARRFRSDYTYGITTFVDGCKKTLGHTKERKTCIWSGGGKSSWLCKSSGIMWVAVHGTDSICVVTKAEKLDRTRVDGELKWLSGREILHRFRETVISEIEDLADPSSGLHELFALDVSIRKPLGVVSVTEGFDKFHAECSHEAPSSADFDEEKAVEFLQEKMKRGLAFTYNETVQTAINAFQQLFHQKFIAKEIRACAWKYEDDIGYEVPRCDIEKFIAAE